MRISGIGTDIVAIDRIRRLWEKYGDGFAARLLADCELEAMQAKADPVPFLAKRFAAKEAASKALGTGFRDGLSLRHIVVVSDALGKPGLSFRERGLELVRQQSVCDAHLSLADERDYAVAYVILTACSRP